MSYRQLGATFSASASVGSKGSGWSNQPWKEICSTRDGLVHLLDRGDGRYSFVCGDGFECRNRPEIGELDCVYPEEKLPSPFSLCFPARVKFHNVKDGNELILCEDDKMFVRGPDGKTDTYSQQEVRGVFEAGHRAEKKKTITNIKFLPIPKDNVLRFKLNHAPAIVSERKVDPRRTHESKVDPRNTTAAPEEENQGTNAKKIVLGLLGVGAIFAVGYAYKFGRR